MARMGPQHLVIRSTPVLGQIRLVPVMRCIFCGLMAEPKKEDALTKWAIRAMKSPGPFIITAIDHPTGPRRQVGRPLRELKVVLKDSLCERCNSAWLGGRIEKPTARLLGPMAAHMQPALLTAGDQALLSFWAVKTAFLLELAIRQMQPGERAVQGYAPSDVELAYMWKYNKPPPRSRVWMGCFDCEMSKPLVYEPSSAQLPCADGRLVVGHLTTFDLGFVAFQVFSVDFVTADEHQAVEWRTRVPSGLSDYLVRIWPQLTRISDVSWPPKQFRSDEWRRLVTWDGELRPGGLNG